MITAWIPFVDVDEMGGCLLAYHRFLAESSARLKGQSRQARAAVEAVEGVGEGGALEGTEAAERAGEEGEGPALPSILPRPSSPTPLGKSGGKGGCRG